MTGPRDEAGPFDNVDAPPVVVADAVTLLDGSCFCISNRLGDMTSAHADGLFMRDTRLISRWVLRIDGRLPEGLTVQQNSSFGAVFVSRLHPSDGEADSTVTVERRRRVHDGMHETVTLRNSTTARTTVEISLEFDADLADLFEVKAGRAVSRHVTQQNQPGGAIHLTERGNGARVELAPPGSCVGATVGWRTTFDGPGSWSVEITVRPIVDGLVMLPSDRTGGDNPVRRLIEWRTRSPVLETSDRALSRVLRRSRDDLGSLRIFEPGRSDRVVVAAGAPWFMALFGRDSLITSWMAMPVDARLAIGTLQTLADHQGYRIDAASEEQPGRIAHELRFGPSSPLQFGARHAYYGSADATPLFVALFGELRRWGHDGPEVRALIPAVDKALEWIATFGDADGDGFVEYERITDAGLINQGWKDSWDGISFTDGPLAEAPIALAEVQAYTYAAYIARAELSRDLADPAGEVAWRAKAAELKARFNQAFWLPDRGWYAVGLDRNKRPIDALTSNPGHCLWMGLADEEKAASVARHLSGDDMFTGWGVRTLARSMARHNPVSYHNGSVWPHDTAICVAGLARYGHIPSAQRIARGVLDAAIRFDGRLPELFCGFDRRWFSEPVPYPTSCSPQAWAAAAPLLVVRSLLRFDPDVTAGRVWCSPTLPQRYLPLAVHDLELGAGRITLTVQTDGYQIDGDTGVLQIIRRPRPPTEAASPSGSNRT